MVVRENDFHRKIITHNRNVRRRYKPFYHVHLQKIIWAIVKMALLESMQSTEYTSASEN